MKKNEVTYRWAMILSRDGDEFVKLFDSRKDAVMAAKNENILGEYGAKDILVGTVAVGEDGEPYADGDPTVYEIADWMTAMDAVRRG